MRSNLPLSSSIPELDPEMLAIVEAFAAALIRIKKADAARLKAEETAEAARAEATSRSNKPEPEPDVTGPRFLRVAEVAKKLSISRGTIYRKVNEGTFPQPRKFGRSVRWLSTDIDAWMGRLLGTSA